MKEIDPPPGLQEPGAKFYRQALNESELSEGHDLIRLFLACRCLDEIEENEQIVAKEGRFILDRFQQQKEHPASKAIRDNKILFCRIIRELGLDLITPDDPRPRRQY